MLFSTETIIAIVFSSILAALIIAALILLFIEMKKNSSNPSNKRTDKNSNLPYSKINHDTNVDTYSEDTELHSNADYQKVVHYNFNREFVMGSKAGFDHDITPNSDIYQKVLCSRPPTNIKISAYSPSNDPRVKVIVLDDIAIGASWNPKQEIDNNGKPIYFKKIEIQSHTHQADDIKYFHWLGINYMRLIDQNDKETVIGTYHKEKQGEVCKKKLKIYYDDVQTETGQLFLTAVYVSRMNIVAFQFADIVDINTNSLLSVYHMHPNQSLHEIGNDSEQILYGHMIGIEDELPYTILLEFLDFAVNWSPLDPVVPRQADFIKILNKCMDGDLTMMHSFMAVRRYIDYSIQTNTVNIPFNEHHRETTKMNHLIQVRQYWVALYNAVFITKCIYYYTPTLDIYSVTYLNPCKWNYFCMLMTFITQLSMLSLIISSIKYQDVHESLETNILSVSISIIICFIVIVLVKRQIGGVWQFYQTFPESIKSLSMILSIIANIFIATIIVPLNFVIIAVTNDRFDLVLNALAILFILEIDDQMVDINAVDEKGIYLSHIYQTLMTQINSVDKKYVKTDLGKATANREECKLIFKT